MENLNSLASSLSTLPLSEDDNFIPSPQHHTNTGSIRNNNPNVAWLFIVLNNNTMTEFWSDLTDVASSGIGGRVLFATDDWFARCEYLISPKAPVFDPNAFTDYGKLMDGWETRRKRIPGHDWCIIELAAPSRVYGFEVDTAFFTGNQSPRVSVQGIAMRPEETPTSETRDALRLRFQSEETSPKGGFAATESQTKAAAVGEEQRARNRTSPTVSTRL